MRYLALADDATTGGTNYDVVKAAAGVIAAPLLADFAVVTSATTDPGEAPASHADDVNGRRAQSPDVAFRAAPSMNFESRAWTGLSRRALRKAMGGSIVTTGGTSGAAYQSTVQMAQSNPLPALIGTLVREDQVDRMTGLWVNELTFDFPADGEGSMSGTLKGLYHDVDDIGSVSGLPNPAGAPVGQRAAYSIRRITAYRGTTPTVIDCLGGFGFTLNNNLSEDPQVIFCAGKDIYEVTIDGILYQIQYPHRQSIGAQTVTGRLDFGKTAPDQEARRIARAAEKLVVEVAGPPLGTTPAADEMQRLIFWKQAPTGGGADALAHDGDQKSSYEFTAYVDDATGKDLEAVFVAAAALT